MQYTAVTTLVKSCSNELNKFARRIVKRTKFGYDFTSEVNNSVEKSVFVHSIVNQLAHINNDVINSMPKLVGMIANETYKNNNLNFEFDMAVKGMLANYLFLRKQEFFNSAYFIKTEQRFYNVFEDTLVMIQPDLICSNGLVDYKNYSNHSYDYRQLIYYMLCFDVPSYSYINLLKGEILSFYADEGDSVQLRYRMAEELSKKLKGFSDVVRFDKRLQIHNCFS